MSHLDQVALVRDHVTREEYSAAVALGRDELVGGRDSSELLVLMATASLLGDGNSGSLGEARQWLERAVNGDPRSVDASLELAHLLDAVEDEGQLAGQLFESAAAQSLGYLEDALAGLTSTGNPAPMIRQRLTALLQSVFETDASSSAP